MRRFRTLMLALTGPLLLAACGAGPAPGQPPADTAIGATIEVRDTLVAATVEAAGTAEPIQQATLSTRLMATVEEVTVHEGSRVAAGQVLVRLDARDLAARQAQVEAGLAEAEAVEREASAMARRMRSLFADSAATRVQLEQAETGLARAEAAVRTARAAAAEVSAMRAYATITAPFAGTVVRRAVDPGAMAAPGSPLVVIEDAARLRVRVAAAPSQVRGLRVGAAVDVQVEGRTVPGRVEGVVRAPAGNLTQVNVLVDNRDAGMASGSAAIVLLPQETRATLVVPAAAIVREGDLAGVELVVAGAVQRRWVQLGRLLPGGLVEVLAGVTAGDRVLAAPEPAGGS